MKYGSGHDPACFQSAANCQVPGLRFGPFCAAEAAARECRQAGKWRGATAGGGSKPVQAHQGATCHRRLPGLQPAQSGLQSAQRHHSPGPPKGGLTTRLPATLSLFVWFSAVQRQHIAMISCWHLLSPASIWSLWKPQLAGFWSLGRPLSPRLQGAAIPCIHTPCWLNA